MHTQGWFAHALRFAQRDSVGGRLRQVFEGQQPGEHVVFALRPHPLYALFVSWRALLLTLLAVAVCLAWKMAAIALPPSVATLLIVAMLGLPLTRLALDLLNCWYSRRYILTDWRVIDARGLFFRRRKELALAHVQQVVVERPNVLAGLLDIGSVVVLSGGDQNVLRLEWVSHPSGVSHALQLHELAAEHEGPADLDLRSPAARALWAKIDRAGERMRPPLEAPDAVPSVGVPFALLNEYGERVLERIPRHWSALARGLILPVLVAVAGVLLAVLVHALNVGGAWIVLAVAWVVALIWGALQYLNFADDLLILTTLRVVDLDRVLYVVAENRRQAMYDKVQNVRVVTPFWGRIFGYGTIYIETAGRSDDLEMSHIGRAGAVQDRIFRYMQASAEHTSALEHQRRRREAKRWLAEMLDELLVEVPDVRGLSLLDAAECLRAVGLRIVVAAERTDVTIAPGTVVEQEPLGGSSALHGSEARVVLSRHVASAYLDELWQHSSADA